MAYETEIRRDADRYSDLCLASERRERLLDGSQMRCSLAVSSIKAIRNVTARDVCNLIEAVHVVMARALSGDEADTAIEFLMDAYSIAQRQAEQEEA